MKPHPVDRARVLRAALGIWQSADAITNVLLAARGEPDPAIETTLDQESRQPAFCRKHQLEQAPGPRGGGIVGLDITAERNVRAALIRIGSETA